MTSTPPSPSDSPDKLVSKPSVPVVTVTTLEILRAHQGMMWTVVAKFGFDFAFGMVFNESPLMVKIPFLCAFVAVELAIAYFVFRLANAIYGIGPGITCAALSILPCLGVFVVLILNGTTADLVRKAGVKIGFMGVTKAQLEALIVAMNIPSGTASVAETPQASS